MAGNSADIGIRVFLDDAASGALGSINGALGRMASSTSAASRAMGDLSGAMAGVGVVVGFAAAFLAFAAAIKYSVDAASAFQQAMFSVAVATHVPLDAAMQYSNTLMNLAASSTYTSTEIAAGIVQMGRAGYSIHDIFTQMAQSGAGFVSVGGRMVPIMSSMASAGIALGIATRSTAEQGFTMLTQAMAAYQAPADQALHYANILQFAFEHQRGTVSELTSALGQVLPVAGQLGVPLRAVAAALDVVGPVMKSTSSAGVALRYMLQGIYTPTDQAKAEMIALGLASVDAGGHFHSAFYNARGGAVDFQTAVHILSDHLKGLTQEDRMAALKNLFSTKGGQGADILLGNIKQLDQYLDQLKQSSDNAGGAMTRWNQVMGTLGGAFAGLKSSVTDLAVIIGTQFLPILTNIATQANGFITSIRNMASANPGAAASFLRLGVAMAGVGLVATIVILAIAGIGTGILAFIGIVAGVAAGVVLLTVGIMLLANWFRNLYNSSALVRSIIGNLGAMFNQLGSDIRSAVVQALQLVQQALATTGLKMHDLEMAGMLLGAIIGVVFAVLVGVVVGAITGIIYALVTFVAGIAMMVAGVIQMLSGFAQFFVGLFNLIKGIITGNGALINQAWHQMWDGIVTATKGLLMIIVGLFVAIGGTIVMAVYGIVIGIINWFIHLANVLVGHSIIPDMLNAIRNAFISILTGIVGWIGGWVNSIISFFARMGSQVVSAVTAAWNFVRSVITIALAAVVAVVSAGFAMVVSRVLSAGASIVSAVTGAWNSVRSFIASAAASIVATVLSLGASIVSAVTNAFNTARSVAASVLASIVSTVSNGFNTIVSRVSSAGQSIISTANNAWNGFKNAVSNGINGAVGLVQGGVSRIIGAVSGLPGQLFSWGARAMQSFADGLGSVLGAVVDKVQQAAQSVANFLAHTSPAKMGPLSSDDQWMPNMMKMFASGIDTHAPLLQNAISRAAGGMASVPQMTRTGAPTIGAGGGTAGVVGNQIIQLVVDGRVLTQVVMNNLTGQMQLNGGGRAFR